MNTTETKVKLVKGNSVIYATLRRGEFKRFTKDGETVCDGEFQKLGGAPETRHGDYAAMKRLFHEFVGAKCVDGYTVEGSAAAALGRRGGASTSPAKRTASRANGTRGGRPQTDLSRAVDETISILDKVHPDRAAWMGQFRAVTRRGLTVADRAARLADILASLGWQDDPRFGALYDALNREPEE